MKGKNVSGKEMEEMGNNKLPSLRAKLEQKRELRGKISELKSLLFSPKFLGLATKGIKCGEARSRLESFIYLHGNDKISDVPERKKNELQALQNNFSKLVDESRLLTEEKDSISSTIAGLENDLQLLGEEVTAADIAESNAEIAQVQADLDKIVEAIERQEEIITSNPPDSSKDLEDQRQAILAEQALGGDNNRDFAKELNAVDNAISKRDECNARASRIAFGAGQVAEGLRKKHQATTEKHDALTRDHRELVILFLGEEFAAAEVKYKAATATLGEEFRRLAAVAMIIENAGGVSAALPTWGHPPCSMDELDIPGAIVSEKSRLQQLGL